jgi:ethanolamine ammonia-lyase small subunit
MHSPKSTDRDLARQAPASAGLPAWLSDAALRTPARLFVGRAGPSLPTAAQLQLKADHAAALDAVHAPCDLERDFDTAFVARHGLFSVETRAGSKAEYLLRPDLGRQLSPNGRDQVRARCPRGADLQIVLGDGLSATAVAAQVLETAARSLGWILGQPFYVRHCRVGVLNDVGELLDPAVAVLLIGERPGLATAESLSAYLAYRPRAGHTDAQRNLISNIHSRGVPLAEAAARIIALAGQMRERQTSGIEIKELPRGPQLQVPLVP